MRLEACVPRWTPWGLLELAVPRVSERASTYQKRVALALMACSDLHSGQPTRCLASTVLAGFPDDRCVALWLSHRGPKRHPLIRLRATRLASLYVMLKHVPCLAYEVV